MDSIVTLCSAFADMLEGRLLDVPRWKVVVVSFVSTSFALWAKKAFAAIETDVISHLKRKAFRTYIKLPHIQKRIQAELDEARTAIEDELICESEKSLAKFNKLPEEGASSSEVKKLAAEALNLGKYEWKKGKVSGGMFAGTDESYSDFMVKLFDLSSWRNPLHRDLFPGVAKMVAEIVKMTASIFHGDQTVVGTVTTGGTESLVMMMKAYRDWAYHTRGVRRPEVVGLHTVHPAVDKGVAFLGYARYRKVRVDLKTMNFKISDIAKNINSNTVLIVVSAPDCAYGCIDDVEAVGALARKKGIPLHVDCCLGGFILPFMDEAGFPLAPFDFRVPGVTSISADNHKFGRAPKGTSVILYRSKEFLHHQYFSVPDWPGGIYATPNIPGSRSGSNIAMCWAAMILHGVDGYVDNTRKIITMARYLKKEFDKIPGLFVYGDPKGPVVAVGSNDFNIYMLADALSSKGWHLQPLQDPLGIHIYLTPLHAQEGVADNLIKVMREAVEDIKLHPKAVISQGMARLYGMANALPDKGIIEEISKIYFDVYYSTQE